MNHDDEKVLYSKKGFLYKRVRENDPPTTIYSLQFDMETPHLYIETLLDFPMVKLLYDLNHDVYETVHMEVIDDWNARIFLVVKPLFRDAGIPQWYLYIHVQKSFRSATSEQPACVQFFSQPIYHLPADSSAVCPPKGAIPLPLRENTFECQVMTPHKVSVRVRNQMDTRSTVPPFMENMMGLISFKIFDRFRRFMESWQGDCG